MNLKSSYYVFQRLMVSNSRQKSALEKEHFIIIHKCAEVQYTDVFEMRTHN